MEMPISHYLSSIVLVILAFLLASFFRVLLFVSVIVITLVAVVLFVLQTNHSQLEVLGFIKLMGLVPMGLGSLVGFSLLAASKQENYRPLFNLYINIAVVGNIIIMIFVPTGETIRGLVSPVVCLMLTLWLCQEIGKVCGKTTFYDQGFFIFNSSPLPWVLCHSCYRMALLSLPAFDSMNYLLLEPLSLLTMAAFYWVHQKKYPINFYFGYGDTLVVSILALASRFLELPTIHVPLLHKIANSSGLLDAVFVPIQIVVLALATGAVVSNLQQPKSL